jgi:YggT family protein
MFNEALQFLLKTIVDLFVLAALVRFYLQYFRAPFRNPLSDFVVALTDFAVKPLRRVIPGLQGLDLASLVFAWGLEVLLMLILLSLQGFPVWTAGPHVVPVVLLLGFINLLKYSIYLLIAAVFIQAVLSWVSPYSPISPVLESVTRPFMRPLRKLVPTVGRVDLSPLVLFVICQIILMVPLAWLESMAIKMV